MFQKAAVAELRGLRADLEKSELKLAEERTRTEFLDSRIAEGKAEVAGLDKEALAADREARVTREKTALLKESTAGKRKSKELHRKSLVPEARKKLEAARAEMAKYEAECRDKLAEYRRQLLTKGRGAKRYQGSGSCSRRLWHRASRYGTTMKMQATGRRRVR